MSSEESDDPEVISDTQDEDGVQKEEIVAALSEDEETAAGSQGSEESGQDEAGDTEDLQDILEEDTSSDLAVTSWQVLQNRIIISKNGDVITLGIDLEAGDEDTMLTIPQGKDITLDLNGHTLSRELAGKDPDTDGHVLYVPQGASLHLISSSGKKGLVTGDFANNGGSVETIASYGGAAIGAGSYVSPLSGGSFNGTLRINDGKVSLLRHLWRSTERRNGDYRTRLQFYG